MSNKKYLNIITANFYITILYFDYLLGFNNYKLMSIGNQNHSLMGAYGPGNNFVIQTNFQNFLGSLLNMSVSTSDTGSVLFEGVTYNWLRRQLVFCGGKQVYGFIIRHCVGLLVFPVFRTF